MTQIQMKKRDFERSCYEMYKLQWLMQHGYTVNDIVNKMARISDEMKADGTYPEGNSATVFNVLLDAVEEEGFGNGECYVSFDEFLDAEFNDHDYMWNLLGESLVDERIRRFYGDNYLIGRDQELWNILMRNKYNSKDITFFN